MSVLQIFDLYENHLVVLCQTFDNLTFAFGKPLVLKNNFFEFLQPYLQDGQMRFLAGGYILTRMS